MGSISFSILYSGSRLAHFAVLARPPAKSHAATVTLADCIPDELLEEFELEPGGLSARVRGADAWLRLLEIAALDVSSTEIRARLRTGRSVRYLVPEAVREALGASDVYGAQSPPAVSTA